MKSILIAVAVVLLMASTSWAQCGCAPVVAAPAPAVSYYAPAPMVSYYAGVPAYPAYAPYVVARPRALIAPAPVFYRPYWAAPVVVRRPWGWW